MPKARAPSQFNLKRIGEIKPILDENFDEILKYFPVENRQNALEKIKTIFNAHKISSSLRKQQVQTTTPSAVIVQLQQLNKALAPFIDQTLGCDEQTYDMLHIRSLEMNLVINNRIATLKEIDLNGGVEKEYRYLFVEHCNQVFIEHRQKDSNIKQWRNFLSLCLDLAEFSYPDPSSSQSKFDETFRADTIYAELGAKKAPT